MKNNIWPLLSLLLAPLLLVAGVIVLIASGGNFPFFGSTIWWIILVITVALATSIYAGTSAARQETKSSLNASKKVWIVFLSLIFSCVFLFAQVMLVVFIAFGGCTLLNSLHPV